MIRLIYFSIIILLYPIVFLSQSYPHFGSPVKHKIALSGSFGELRTGHFHAGLDIKSKYGIEGDSIFSIGAGFISRIKVEPGGYGYSLYIDHPNGYTSVYAHLKDYNDYVKDYVYQVQAEFESFTIDHNPPQEAFPLADGEFIGFMGNSGKSFGAHLHFEIRKTENDKLLNPLLFGIKPSDSKFPVIQSLIVLEYDSLQQIQSETVYDIKQINQNTFELRDTIYVNSKSHTELSLKMFDRMNGSVNKNGIYKIGLLSDHNQVYDIQFDSMEFNDSKGIDFVLDKRTKSKLGTNHYLLPLKPFSYPFSFTHQDTSFKNIHFEDISSVVVSDLEDNISTLKITIKENKLQNQSATQLQNYTIPSEKPSLINLENFKLFFPQNSFYSQQALYVKELQNLLVLDPAYVKLHKNISIHYTSQDALLNEKYCFAHISSDGEYKLIQNCKIDSICSASISSLENVIFLKDTIPPKITALFSPQRIKRKSILSFKITDNIIPSRKKHLLKYSATIDGQWILFNYDLKSDIISHTLKDSIKIGNHHLELQVTDNQNNTNCFITDLNIY